MEDRRGFSRREFLDQPAIGLGSVLVAGMLARGEPASPVGAEVGFKALQRLSQMK